MYAKTIKSGFRYVSYRNSTKKTMVKVLTDHLHRRMALKYLQLPYDLQQLLEINKTSGLKISIALQTDLDGRFLRLFIGLPIALQVGVLTLPILSIDGCHM